VAMTGIKEIDDVLNPFIARLGQYDLRRVAPRLQQCIPTSTVESLQLSMPASVSHDNEALKRLRHTKNFLVSYCLPHDDLKKVYELLLDTNKDVDMCVGLLSESAEGFQIMVFLRKNNTRFLKKDCFHLEGRAPLALYNFQGVGSHGRDVAGAAAHILSFCASVKKVYGNIVVVPSSHDDGYGFDEIMDATRALTSEQFATLKGRSLATKPKERTPFEQVFLRVAASVSEIRREGL